MAHPFLKNYLCYTLVLLLPISSYCSVVDFFLLACCG